MEETKKITVKDILYLLDHEMSSEEIVRIISCGRCECRAMVGSDIWKGIENRQVENLGTDEGEFAIWLEEE